MQTQVESDRLNYNLSPNFKVREFTCPCCGAEGVKDSLVFGLQDTHDLLPENSVMIITSGYRCKKHNLEVGGVEGGSHPNGTGVDIKCDSSRARFLLLKALIMAGFTRIGIYKKHIHADLDPGKDQEVVWCKGEKS